jgi:hypothetical protein
MKFQHLVFPDGIIGHQYGPIEGRHADSWLLRHSGVLDPILSDYFRFFATPENFAVHNPTEPGIPPTPVFNHHYQYCIYGDAGYTTEGVQLQAPFPRFFATAQQEMFNKQMSRCRIAIEWSFGKIVNVWAYLTLWSRMRVLQIPFGSYYRVATIFTNVHTCLYGSEATTFFDCRPPTVEMYLSW